METWIQYAISAAISGLAIIIAAVIAYRGRRIPSGDAELADRQTYYATVAASETALRKHAADQDKQLNLLEKQRDELHEVKEKLEDQVDLLTKQNEIQADQLKQMTEQVAVLKQERQNHLAEIDQLKNDVVRLNREMAELKEQNAQK